MKSKKEHTHFQNASHWGPHTVLGTSYTLYQGMLADINEREYPWDMEWGHWLVKLIISISYDPAIPPLDTCQSECWHARKQTCTRIYTATRFRTVPNWKLPKYPFIVKWRHGSLSIQKNTEHQRSTKTCSSMNESSTQNVKWQSQRPNMKHED